MDGLRARIRDVLAGFWFVPLVTGIALAALALGLVAIDRAAGPEGVSFGFPGDASAARSILSVVAGSLITVVAVTFSLTVVTLQLVSGQFTPRAVRGTLANRTTQLVAGVFVGVVAYALIVLRSVRDRTADSSGELPALATSVAIVLALLALALLVYFVHHIGTTIQVSTMTARIGRQTLATVEKLFRGPFEESTPSGGRDALLSAWRAGAEPVVVHPSRSGYVQVVACADIARALPEGGRAAIAIRPGDFVTASTPGVELWGAEQVEAVEAAVAKAVVIADERDLRGDVAFGLRQLVDVALRALSPGINDPTSAVTAMGHVQAVLEQLAGRSYPTEELRIDERVVLQRVTDFGEHLSLGLDEVGREASRSPRVACALLDSLAHVARAAARASARDRADAVVAQACRIAAQAVEQAPTPHDADEIRRRLGAVVAAAGGLPAS